MADDSGIGAPGADRLVSRRDCWCWGPAPGLFRSWRAALVFALAGLASMLFWHLHRWIVARMLTPSVRMRWAVRVPGPGQTGVDRAYPAWHHGLLPSGSHSLRHGHPAVQCVHPARGGLPHVPAGIG